MTLFGGATLPEARGRGAYRALVAARWEDAVAARNAGPRHTGEPDVAGRSSKRLGFREVCEIRILLDAFGRRRMRVSAKADYAIRADGRAGGRRSAGR